MNEDVAYAGAIAEKLQGAHERRRNGREDMKVEKGESVWSPEKREVVDRLAERVYDELMKLVPDQPQASAVSAERVVELERQLADALVRAEEAEESYRQITEQGNLRADELEQLLATAYVQREVGWADVAAGMMTIARDSTPWMVKAWVADASTVVLQQGSQAFEKTPADGETVRVLVPYVTPEAAEGLVREQLGGTAVS